MIVRWFGAILVFLSCSGIGFIKAARYRKELRYLSDFVRILDFMTCELEYRLSPLPHICKSAAEMTQGSLQKVFSLLAQELESQVSPNARICLQIVMNHVHDIPQRLQRILDIFSESLGCYDLDGQLLQIAAVRQESILLLEQMQTEGKERIRNDQTLGICAGAGLAILFL